MTISIYRREVYGETKFYFVGSDAQTYQVEAMQRLTGKTTLTNADRKQWEVLGFTFEEIINPN